MLVGEAAVLHQVGGCQAACHVPGCNLHAGCNSAMRKDGAGLRTALKRVRITARGRVQGVGFRPTFCRALTDHGCGGSIRNTPEGVVLEAEGEASVIEDLVRNFRSMAPPRAEVLELDVEEVEPVGESSFKIAESSAEGRSLLPIPPDLATCEECLRELCCPEDRRHRYPFNTCTACGPRFTITRSVPFDRISNSMDEFPPCALCTREYGDSADRRFHAQTISCPRCGPRLSMLNAEGKKLDRPLDRAAEMLKAGKMLAVKGIGGFHLACDATSDEAVGELRRRKKRPYKPLAIMVRGIEECRSICKVNHFQEEVLLSAQSPIVLLKKRSSCGVSEAVAPGLRDLGVMLPYTPLHYLLFRHEDMPLALVMTSCNRAEEPISTTEEAVLNELSDIVDDVLTHDRQIVNRCDDSVVATFGGRLLLVRRSRGYVPEPILMRRSGPPALAVGAMLKNTFAMTSGRRVFLSQHIGDVSDADNAAHFARSFERFSQLLRLDPQVVVCDMHPDYPTTAFARELSDRRGLELLQVQHHHAHIASCLAENGSEGPVIGVSMDGSGYGEDGAVWGGEFLVADLQGYTRRCHLEYVPMAGGEQAVLHTERMALAHLAHALGPDRALSRMEPLMGKECCRLALQVMEKPRFSPLTSSCGRLFDAVSALLGIRKRITYRGQAACELEACCDAEEKGAYDFDYDGESILLEGTFRGICEDLDASRPRQVIAARFHNTVARIILETCVRMRDETGIGEVALSGGVMQNRHLLGLAVPALRARGFEVLLQTAVPPNDGGICLGQAACALARFGSSSRG